MENTHTPNEDMVQEQQEQLGQIDELVEEDQQDTWMLNPKFPSDEELLYPGQEVLKMELDYFDDEKQEDKLWQARTGLDFDSLCGAIETIVFMSDRPLSINKIKALIDEDMPLRVIHTSIVRLQEEYEVKHHGLRLVEVADGYQFRTKATYSKYVQDLFKVNSLVLSPTALEVLAIVAYKQPVAKPDVDKIRGVDSGHIVRGLIDKRLVKVVGRSDEMGRPVLYGTTPEFLEVFNLANVDQLPPEKELEETIDNNIGKISDIKTIVTGGEKDRFVFDDTDELDELARSIKMISADTDFTSAIRQEEKFKKSGTDTSEENRPRSAFDLLEEYVSKQAIIDTNIVASDSEMMSASADPLVVSDLTAGPFNAPDFIDEDDDFKMVDLDSGESIEDEILGEDLLGDSDEEAEELSKALDEAFERLTGEKLDDDHSESDRELALDATKLEKGEAELAEMTADIISQGDSLDLDLSFLQDDNENNH